MDTQQATELINSTFETQFDEVQYRHFINELLNGKIDTSREYDYYGQYIKNAFKDYVRRYKRIGIYTDPNGDEIDLIIVYLHREASLDRARTMQRNFAADLLKDKDRDNILLAYTADESTGWRFSMVQREVMVAFSDAGNLVSRDELTPVRRFSFLVGENEPNHTAKQQLFPILLDSSNDPTVRDFEAAFDIEKVTKEFFERYKERFLDLKDELDRLVAHNSQVAKEFEEKKLDTTNFAKKLLGQIVFLYFLQKKGWLGVEQGKDWGTGAQNFLKLLFDRRVKTYDNFFNDILEPLFYEALAIDRAPSNYYDRLEVCVPFLNGGLFEPVNNYDWRGVDVNIDNAIFEDIFATFDLYNFTVREDEPLEKEVAVDPEMLGKVFENLLEVKDRKSKGAFYTPREIVNYMCQESLISYLDTHLDTVTRDDLSVFIQHGQVAIQNDIAKESGTVSYKYIMPDSIRENATLLDQVLADLRICDPAIGSGAFPVGIMQEIVKAREVLSTYFQNKDKRSTYDLKRHAIQENIYGVDIDSGAIDIAKLRLWLSLVVDENDYHHIKPLPNLDYKIVAGDSLISVKKDIFNHHLFNNLEDLKNKYFDVTDHDEKQKIKKEIDDLIEQLVGDENSFDYEVYFSEVFRGTKATEGFDIVIGNPPYVRHERITDQKDDLKNNLPEVYTGTADLFTYFFAKGIRILRSNGILTLITPNKFMRAGYGEKLRKFLNENTVLETLIDFGDLQIFDATTYPLISIMRNTNPTEDSHLRIFEVEELDQTNNLQLHMNKADLMPQSALEDEGWQLRDHRTLSLMQKLSDNTALIDYVENDTYRGVTTGRNKAFEIDEETYENTFAHDEQSAEIIKPWVRGRDVKRWKVDWSNRYLIFTRRGINIDSYPTVKDYLLDFKDILEPGTDSGRKAGSYEWYEIQDSTAYYKEFERPKIIWAKYGVEPAFAYDTIGYFGGNTVFILPTDDLFLLGILNSRVIQWYAQNTFNIVRGGYIEWIPTNVANLPIPEIDEPQKAELSSLVRQLINPSIKPAEMNRLEREVDRYVYELYGLDADAVELIERDLEIEANQKTADFFDSLWKMTGDKE